MITLAQEMLSQQKHRHCLCHCIVEWIDGIIDEVRVLDVALTEDDIKISMEGFAAVSSDGKLPAIWAEIKTFK
ncbi:hypothetical protein ACFL6S_22580 [Candidatus Poribacteria bacterium]